MAKRLTPALQQVKALTFDVFGTVVDWRGSISREGRKLGKELGIRADWAAFADAWRAGYQPAMQEVRSGRLAWTNIDGLHRRILERILDASGLDMLSEAEKDQLNRAWHRLAPWPDALRGLTMFKQLDVPVLGVIENMSYLPMPDGTHMDLFGRGGGRKLAEQAGVPFIGEVPIDPKVRVGGDTGVPIVVSDPESAAGQALIAIAQDVAAKVSVQTLSRQQSNLIQIQMVD